MTTLNITQSESKQELRVPGKTINFLYNLDKAGANLTLSGNVVLNSGAYGVQIDYLTAKYPMLHITAPILYLQFEDNNVEQICIDNWGDGIGVTEGLLNSVTNIGKIFSSNKKIIKFNEFRYFTKISSIPVDAFGGEAADPPTIEEIDITQNITAIYNRGFRNCTNLKSLGGTLFPLITYLGPQCFSHTSISGELYFPNVTEIDSSDYGGQFGSCGEITKLKFDKINAVCGGSLQYSEWRCFCYGCAKLRTLDLGYLIQKLSSWHLAGSTPAFQALVIRNAVPPVLCDTRGYQIADVSTISINTDFYGNAMAHIYVPDEAIDIYKEDVLFSKLADRIKPISEYEAGVIDGTFI